MKFVARVHALPFAAAVCIAAAGTAYAQDSWLECAVNRSVAHPDGTTTPSFSMKMVFAYDSAGGGVWTYFPVNQRLTPIPGAQVSGDKISWPASALSGSTSASDDPPTTIDLQSGEYRATSSVRGSDGETVTQIDTGQCQQTAARPVAS